MMFEIVEIKNDQGRLFSFILVALIISGIILYAGMLNGTEQQENQMLEKESFSVEWDVLLKIAKNQSPAEGAAIRISDKRQET